MQENTSPCRKHRLGGVYVIARKIWNIVKKAYYIITLTVMFFIILFLMATVVIAINYNELLMDDRINNMLALAGLGLALPGIALQLFDLFKPDKKRFKGSIICPHCNKTAEINLEET